MVNIGKSIKVALAANSKNQKWLAKELNMEVANVSRLANSETTKLATIEDIAAIFNMSVSEFIRLGED